MSLYALTINANNFNSQIVVSHDAKEKKEAEREIMVWATNFYPAGTLLKVRWVSHETKIDFHSLVAQGYDGMKLL